MPPLTPRPFSQLARRFHRLGLGVPRGLWPALSAAPWYHRRRRRAAVTMSRARFREVRRRRWWGRRPLYLCPVGGQLVLGLGPDPFTVYGSVEVA